MPLQLNYYRFSMHTTYILESCDIVYLMRNTYMYVYQNQPTFKSLYLLLNSQYCDIHTEGI